MIRALGVLAMLGLAFSVAAHEVVLIPSQRPGTREMLLPLAIGSDHLSPMPAALDFGQVIIGQTRLVGVDLSNQAAETVTVVVEAPAAISVSVASFILVPGASQHVDVTWAPAAAGPVAPSLVFAVSHPGAARRRESVALLGSAVTPPRLALDIPAQQLFDVTSFDFGVVGLRPYGFADTPSFDVVVTNRGGTAAEGVQVQIGGPGASFPGFAVCNEGLAEGAVCMAVRAADGTVTATTNLGTIAPNQSVTTVWRIVPAASGAITKSTPIKVGNFTSADTSFSVSGEIVPYAYRGEMFVGAEAGGPPRAATKTFGEATDSAAEDSLAQLRVTSFDASTVFSVGEVDTVDLRSGSVTLIVPLGGAVPVRGSLSYELKAVFNGHTWARKSMGVTETAPEPPHNTTRPLSAEYPNPAFNLRGGWAMHLGRLLPPLNFDGGPANNCNPSVLDFEKSVDTGPRFVYIDPNGTLHEFWHQLHGEELAGTAGAIESYEGKQYLYSRDGSYLRLWRESPTRRWVEEPGGIRRLFVKGAALHPSLPDAWQLREIRDPYANQVTIAYGTDASGMPIWTIRDTENTGGSAWRTVVVAFRDWTGRTVRDPMIVDEVRLPGFSGAAARSYRFAYTFLTLDRPQRSSFHGTLENFCPAIDTLVRQPRLDRITLPDGSAYSFVYSTGGAANDDLRLDSATLPTGATIAYEYQKIQDSPPDCQNRDLSGALPGVSRRTVRDPGGTLLDDRRYLRQTLRTADVPNEICRVFNPGDLSSTKPPWSEQVVSVWSAVEAGLSTVSTHYFNIYPYSDDCGFTARAGCVWNAARNRYVLASGRTHIERNLKISRTPGNEDPLNADLFLSGQLHSCAFGVGGFSVLRDELAAGVRFGDRIPDLLAACTKYETTYSRYDVSRAGLCREASPYCLRDSRLAATRTVYHDDSNKWIKVTNSDFDGLGHYRKTVTRSNFETTAVAGRLEQTKLQNWNAGGGTLQLNPDHTVLSTIVPPATWLLETFREQWQIENGVGRGGEACFHPTLGHMTYDRTWSKSAINENNLAANRSTTDLVTKHSVNAQGELDLQRFFGADTYPGAMPTADTWCASDTPWGASQQDYAVDLDFQFGLLSEQRVVGETTYDTRQTIDQGTGWTKTRTLDSGEVLTHAYDLLGRVTWITTPRTASRRFQYQQQADGRWQLTATTYAKGTTASTPGPSPIRRYVARYDGLGRMIAEDLPKFDGTTVTRTLTYHHPGGQPRLISALDSPARNTQISYDYKGRLLEQINPDGSKLANIYAGPRRTRTASCVGTASTIHAGICSGTADERVETIVDRDWRGRVVSATSPEGFATTMAYDPSGNRTSATRKNTESSGAVVTQNRFWTYNGLGFLTREAIPERSATDFSLFTTRGQATRTTEGGRIGTRSFDKLGRLRSLVVAGRTIREFDYCDQAAANAGRCNIASSANGQLLSATRYNHRDGTTSGIAGQAGFWQVASSFGYDTAGRLASRSTAVQWDPNGAPASGFTTFDQSWSYDDLGNVSLFTYPNGSFLTGGAYAAPRTVSYAFGQGFYLTSANAGSLGATLTYHPSGLIDEVRHSGGGGTDRYSVANGVPRVSAIDLGIGTAQRLDLGAVLYDGASNIKSIGADTFRYDKNSRLVAATVRGSSFTYAYDNFDNHLLSKGTVNPANNQLIGGTTYDIFGNMTGGPGPITAVYDEVDKLIRLQEPSGATVLSIFDHDDLRVLTVRSDGEVTWTLRDGRRVVRELAGLGSGIQHRKDYVYAGSRMIASKAYPSLTERHYHQDQVGSARLITGGNAQQMHYEPFGERITVTGTGERAVGFTGHEDDGITTYMRGRSYLPVGARFLQVDPARDASSWSQYGYASNNPILKRDPTGLKSKTVQQITVTAKAPPRTPANDRLQVKLLKQEFGSLDAAMKVAREQGITFFSSGDAELQRTLSEVAEIRPFTDAGEKFLAAVAMGPVAVEAVAAAPAIASLAGSVLTAKRVGMAAAAAAPAATQAFLNDGKVSQGEGLIIAGSAVLGAIDIPGVGPVLETTLKGMAGVAVVTVVEKQEKEKEKEEEEPNE